MNFPPKLNPGLKKLLHSSFREIGYQYDKLTPQEKECFTPEEFAELIMWLVTP